jgi:hypothetical protein
MSHDQLPPALRENASDRAATILRATLGNIPPAGSLISELIASVIPNQRLDRVADFVARLSRRLNRAEEKLEHLADGMSPEKVALFEDGLRGAASATAETRIEHLAALVAAGLTASEREAEDHRAIVRLLNELNDKDQEWRRENGFDYRWEEREGKQVSVGDQTDSLVEFARQGRLVSMGLMERKVLPPREDGPYQPLEMETEISWEGRELLRRLGLLHEGER